MSQAVHYCLYQLRSASPLNAATNASVHAGMLLLRNGGVGCVHPWPVFGDPPLAEHLAVLKEGMATDLIQRAMECCDADASARARGESLFRDLEIPASHLLLSASLDERLWEAEAELALRDGFTIIKIKCGGPDPDRERSFLQALAGAGDLRFRLDFNARGEVAAFLRGLDPATRDRIDFIEDPVPFDGGTWKRLREEFGVRLARDFEGDPASDPEAFDVQVVKPAREGIPRSVKPMVITTAMDHPIGQMFAAWEAARFQGKLETCGLLTHHCHEPDEFSERMETRGCRLLPPEGTGLGFDDLLAGLEWKKL